MWQYLSEGESDQLEYPADACELRITMLESEMLQKETHYNFHKEIDQIKENDIQLTIDEEVMQTDIEALVNNRWGKVQEMLSKD